jgi:hypothetical protein
MQLFIFLDAGGQPRRSSRLGGMNRATAAGSSVEPGYPSSYQEARSLEHTGRWGEAIHAELRSLELNGTWEYVMERTTSVKPISNKWIFRTKTNPNGSQRYKVRLVIKGFEQTDYSDTYTPVAKLMSFRIMIALAARHAWVLDQMDVITVILNPPIKGEVFMELPEGLEASRGSICKLKEVLYRLKEAQRLLHAHIDRFLRSLVFKWSAGDPNLYMLAVPIQGYRFLLLYVDHLLIAC